MGQELLRGAYIQADETTVGVQMHDGRGKRFERSPDTDRLVARSL